MRDNLTVLARYVIGAGGVALGLVSLSIARHSPGSSFAGSSGAGTVALLAAGWLMMAGALVFGAHRRANRLVPILVAAGCAWFLAEWDSPGAGTAIVFTIGLAASGACPPLIGWAMLSFPTGRLTGPMERGAVTVASMVGFLVLGLIPAALFDPGAAGCAVCPQNLLLVRTAPETAASIGRAGMFLGAASSLLVVGVAAWRFVRSSDPRRRVVAPVVAWGSLYLVLVGTSYATGVDRSFIGTGPLERRLWLAQAAALAGVGLAVGWAAVRARSTRARLAHIVVQLAEEPRQGDLGAALARTLGDPGLELAYPVEGGRHVGASGGEVTLPPADGRSTTPLIRDGTTVGLLVHRPGLLDDPELVEEVAAAARLALENERLQAALRAREEDLRASRARIVATADSERRRLERDLHDGAQQRLIALLLGLRTVPAEPATPGGEIIRQQIDEVAASVQRAVDELRTVAHGIHPAVLSNEGLAAAVEALAEDSPGLSIDAVPDERYPAGVELTAYRIVAETLKAGPTRVRAAQQNGRLVIDVQAAAPPPRLVELQDRVGALDGSLGVRGGPGGVITLRAEIPCG